MTCTHAPTLLARGFCLDSATERHQLEIREWEKKELGCLFLAPSLLGSIYLAGASSLKTTTATGNLSICGPAPRSLGSEPGNTTSSSR